QAIEPTMHESYSRDEAVIGGSDRWFGIVMAAALAGILLLNWGGGGPSWDWARGNAGTFLKGAPFFSAVLKPFNHLWLKFGLLLHKVVNPIVMALVFFGTVLPMNLIMRALGKDPLRLTRQSNTNSYWIERRPPGPAPESMKDQF